MLNWNETSLKSVYVWQISVNSLRTKRWQWVMAVPRGFSALHMYSPSSSGNTSTITSVLSLRPTSTLIWKSWSGLTGWLLKYQVTVGVGTPLKQTRRTARSPSVTVWFLSAIVNLGGSSSSSSDTVYRVDVVVTPGGITPGTGPAGPVGGAACWNWMVTSWPGAVCGGAGADIGAIGSLVNAGHKSTKSFYRLHQTFQNIICLNWHFPVKCQYFQTLLNCCCSHNFDMYKHKP